VDSGKAAIAPFLEPDRSKDRVTPEGGGDGSRSKKRNKSAKSGKPEGKERFCATVCRCVRIDPNLTRIDWGGKKRKGLVQKHRVQEKNPKASGEEDVYHYTRPKGWTWQKVPEGEGKRVTGKGKEQERSEKEGDRDHQNGTGRYS